jgi:hypothetical protein
VGFISWLFSDDTPTRAEIEKQVDERVAEWLTNLGVHYPSLVERTTNLEARMTSVELNEQAEWDNIVAIVAMVLAEVEQDKTAIATLTAALEAAQGELDKERADRDALVAQQVADALAVDAAGDAQRTKGLAERLKTALPVEVPEVPVPDPGTPAEEPEVPTPSEPGTEVPGEGGDPGVPDTRP